METNSMNKSNPGKKLDPQMKVYLLVAPGNDRTKTIGFKAMGSGEVFTFGFSSLEKAKAFLKAQQNNNRLGYLGNEFMLRWVTLQEYSDNPDNALLNLDPPEDFFIDFDLQNFN